MSSHIGKVKAVPEDYRSGLPVEIWRVILSYLGAADLCNCASVSKEWNVLVDSIDSTCWKKLYFMASKLKHWKHPFWPNEIHTTPKSWKNAYRLRYISSKLWLMSNLLPTCSFRIFKRRRSHQILTVGAGKSFRNIKSALEKASPYDQIIVSPGFYQESCIIHLRFPVAIVGADDCSNVVLMMQINMHADSGKLENLTIKPAYHGTRARSNPAALVKVSSGQLFIHNCTFEQGYIYVSFPGIVDINSSFFKFSFLNFQGINFSTVTNCEFKTDGCAIFVEDPPYKNDIRPCMAEDTGGWVAASNEKQFDEYYRTHIKPGCRKNKDGRLELENKKSTSSFITDSDTSDKDSESRNKFCSRLSGKSRLGSFRSTKSTVDNESRRGGEAECLNLQTKKSLRCIKGVIIRNILVSDGRGGITISRSGQIWVENSSFHNLKYGIRCLTKSKCVLLNNKIHSCETTGVFFRDHSFGFVAGNQIFSNGEAGIDIRSGAAPLIQHNEIHSGRRSGIVCLDGGKGMIQENDIYSNKEAGIYVLHRGAPKIFENFIWSGRAAGIAVTEHGRGHISRNVISGMEWAGIDIRHGGNPIVSHNIIQNGLSDGVVIGEEGKSIIFDNHIDGNSGCGVWVLDGSHPLLHSNRIVNSGNSGIAFVNNSDAEHDNQMLTTEYPQQVRMQNTDDVDEDIQSLVNDEFITAVAALEVESESRFIHVSQPEKDIAQVEGNYIENNNGNGILYDGKHGIVISHNHVEKNGKHGITLIHTSEINVFENSIRKNRLSGINVEIGVCCTIEGNGIYENNEYGINSAGFGAIKENDIFAHALPSVCLRPSADISILNNRLNTDKYECIYLDESTRCTLQNNVFYLKPSCKEFFAHPSCDLCDESNVKREVAECSLEEYKTFENFPWLSAELEMSQPNSLRPVYVESVDDGGPYFTTMQTTPISNSVRSMFCILL